MASNRYILKTPENGKVFQDQTPEQLRYGPKLTSTPHVYTTSPFSSVDLGSKLDDSDVPSGGTSAKSEQNCQEIHSLKQRLSLAQQMNEDLQEELQRIDDEKRKLAEELEVLKRLKSVSLNSSRSSHSSDHLIVVQDDESYSTGNQSEDFREQFKRLRKENQDLEEKNFKLHEEKEQVDEALKKKERLFKESCDALRILQQELDQFHEEKTKLAMTNEEKNNRIFDLEQQCMELQQLINDINNEKCVRRKSMSLNASLSFSHLEPKDMAQEVVDLQLRETKEELHKCQEELKEVQGQLSQTSAELLEVKGCAETLKKELEQEKDELAKEKQTVAKLVQEIEKCKKDLCEEMESARVDYEAKINGLQAQISELSSYNSTLEDMTKQQEEQILNLENERQSTKLENTNSMSVLQNQISVLTTDLESKKIRLSELREDLTSRIAEVSKAEWKIQEVQAELNTAVSECESLKEEVRTMEQEKKELKSLNKQALEECESFRTEIKGLVVQLSQLAREKDELWESKEMLDKALSSTKTELEATKKALDIMTLESQSLSRELVTTQHALTESEKTGKNLEEKTVQLQTSLDTTKNALSAAEIFGHNLERAYKDLEVQIESLTRDNSARVTALEMTIATLESSVKDLEDQKHQVERSLVELREEYHEERINAVQKSAELDAKITSLTVDLSAEKEYVSSLTTSLRDKCTELGEAMANVRQLVKDISSKSLECDHLKEKLQEALENANELTSAIKRQEEEICSLNVKHVAVSAEYERKITSLIKENETISEMLSKKEELVSLKSDLLTKSEATVQSKEEQLSSLDQKFENTKTELCEVLRRVTDLEKILGETENTLVDERSKLESSNSRNEKLTAECLKLEEDMKDSKNHFELIITTLREQIDQMQQCNTNLETVSVQQVKDISELRTEIELMACKAKTETEELQRALTAKEADLVTEKHNVQDLQSSLDATLRSLQSATLKAVAWENDYNAAMSELESLAVEANSLKDRNSSSESEITKLTSNLEALQEKFNTEVQRLEESMQKERDGYHKEIEGARNRIQNLTSELATIKNSSEAEIDRLQRIGSTDRDRIQKLENDIHAIMTTNEDLKSSSESTIVALAAQLEDHKQLIESQKKRIEAAEASLNETCRKYDDEIAVLNETIKHFEEEIQSLNASNTVSKEESQNIQRSLMEEIEATKLKMENQEGEMQRLKSELVDSEERQKAHLDLCQKRETDLTQKLSDAHKNYSGLLAGAHEKIKKLQQLVLEQESTRTDVTKQIAEVKAQAIEETKEKYKQRCAEYQKNAFEAIDEFKVKNDSLETKVTELQAEMEKLQDENKLLKEKTEKMDEENNKLLRDRGILRRDLLEYQQKIHSMEQVEARRDDNNGTFRVPSTTSLHRRHQMSDNSLMSMSSASSILGSTNFMDAETALKSHDFGMPCGSERRLSTASVTSNISNTSTSSDKFKAVPTGTGSLFTCEDEDEFQFQEKNIAELKYRRQTGTAHLPGLPRGTVGVDNAFDTRTDKERFSELYRRNSMVPQHLRSCYPSEMMMCNDQEIDETRLKQLSDRMMRTKSGPALRSKEDVVPPTSSLSASNLKSPSKVQLRNGVPAAAQRTPFTIV